MIASLNPVRQRRDTRLEYTAEPDMDTGKREHEALAGLATAFVVGGLLWWAMPRAIQGGDAGEMATVMLRGGVPHPSGYPWIRIAGALARPIELAGSAPALAAALPCAAAGLVGFGLLQRTTSVAAAPWPAAFVTMLVAASGPVLAHVADAEVWGLHVAFVGLFLWVALARRAAAAWLGLALGLAVSHHLTAILLLPLAVGAAWPARASVGALVRRGLAGVGGALVGLSPYLTLAIGSGDAWRWGDTRSAAGLWHHVVRGDYGVTQLSLHDEPVSAIACVRRTVDALGTTFSAGAATNVWVAGLLLAGVAVAARRPVELPRAAWVGLWASIAAATLAFPALHDLDPARPSGAWILERFDLLPALLWTIPTALALTRLRAAVRSRGGGLALALAVPVALIGQITGAWHRGLPREEAGVQAYAVDLLHTPTEPAVVFGTDDHRTFPVLFASEVLGAGPDVLYVDAALLDHAWYRERLQRRWPGLPVADKPVRMMDAMWSDPAFAAVPIYVANPFSRPVVRLSMVPEGILWRVLRPDQDPRLLNPAQLTARHVAALSRYQARPEAFAGLQAPRGHPWSADLWPVYVDHTLDLAAAMRANGREDLAAQLHQAFADLAGESLPRP
jgi:hypothetical protein